MHKDIVISSTKGEEYNELTRFEDKMGKNEPIHNFI